MAITDSTNPLAGISGPGPYAKRTDLQYQSPEYGAGVQYEADKSAVPLAKTADVLGATNTEVRQAADKAVSQDSITSLYAPSSRKNEDIMHGTDVPGSPGGGSNVLMMQSQFAQTKLSDTLAQMLPYDQTGEVAVLYQQALARGM